MTDKPVSIAQLFDLLETPTSPGDKSIQVVRQEIYDSDLYNDILGDSSTLQDTVARGTELLAVFEHLQQDIYISLFKLEPEILPDEEISEHVRVNKQLVEAFFESEDFQKLRGMTQLEPLSSALATQVLGEKTIQKLESSQKDKQQNPDNTGNPDTDSVSVSLGLSGQEITDAVTSACQAAAEQVAEMARHIKAWGIEPGDPSLHVSLKSKRKALERLRSSPRLQKLSDLIGRFRHLARQVYRKKRSNGAANINSVTTGGDLERVLPSEKIMLAHKATKPNFIRRYHQRELLQYKYKSQAAGKGPLVVCCDVSGSMAGRPEEWAKATTLALAEVAQRQKRDFACVLFNSKVVETWTIPRGIWNPGAIIDMAEMAPSGGTNFTAPLSRAMEIINESRFRKADIVFITDGHCKVGEDFINKFNRARQRKGFMVFTVLISAESSPVNSFSDEVITLNNLAQLDEGSAATLFSHVRDRDGALR